MIRSSTCLFLLLCIQFSFAQVKVDLDRSVPVWFEYDENNNGKLKWIADENASTYMVSATNMFQTLIDLATLEGDAVEYDLGTLNPGELYQYHISKDIIGRGIINVGIELEATHARGRCLIVIDDILPNPLEIEINQLILDIEMAHDNRVAGKSDNVVDALDYAKVSSAVLSHIESGRFLLVERVAEEVAELIMSQFAVPWVKIRLTKPGAVVQASGVGVIIERGNP